MLLVCKETRIQEDAAGMPASLVPAPGVGGTLEVLLHELTLVSR